LYKTFRYTSANNQRLEKHLLLLPQVLDIVHLQPRSFFSVAGSTAALSTVVNRSTSTLSDLLAYFHHLVKNERIVPLLTHNYIKTHDTECS